LPDLLYVTYWGNDFYVSTAREGALLDGKLIPANFAFRFDCLGELRFEGFRILYRQLQLLHRWFRKGSNGVPPFSLAKIGRLIIKRPSDEASEKTCTLKPAWLALTESGRERRLDWQDILDFDGAKTRVSEVAEVILALSAGADAKNQRSAAACLLEFEKVSCGFGRKRGLSEISCLATGGQMVAIMGPSGCGKSTLLGTMIGSVPLTAGNIRVNGADLNDLVKENPRLLGYVPQDNITFATLTVAENLRFGARLRLAQPTKTKIDECVSNALDEIDLRHRADVIVGNEDIKTLSGGQRKRVSLGLELLTSKSILLLDEPTSGLSSGDSERILRILRARADAGALVFVVIHQPSAKLFRLFDRLLLLDDGIAAFYGDPLHALSYLQRVAPVATASDQDDFDPGNLLAALEAPPRRVDGRTEEGRMFEPPYWKARFDWFRRKYFSPKLAPELNRAPPDEQLQGWLVRQVRVFFERSFLCKLRDALGLMISLGTAIVLGVVIGCILSSRPELVRNDLFPSFPFLSCIVALFIGMSSSITEVPRERPIMRREKLLKVNLTFWLISKFATLVLTNFIPVLLYTLISMGLLQLPEYGSLFLNVFYLWLISAVGVALGLAISSIPNIGEAAATNFLPLVLVPQLVLAGADPFAFGNLQHLLFGREKATEAQKTDHSVYIQTGTDFVGKVPQIANVMPSRWGYEGLISLYVNNSKWTAEEKIRALSKGKELEAAYESARSNTGAQISESKDVFLDALNELASNLKTIEAEAPSVVLGKHKAALAKLAELKSNYQSEASKKDFLDELDKLASNLKTVDSAATNVFIEKYKAALTQLEDLKNRYQAAHPKKDANNGEQKDLFLDELDKLDNTLRTAQSAASDVVFEQKVRTQFEELRSKHENARSKENGHIDETKDVSSDEVKRLQTSLGSDVEAYARDVFLAKYDNQLVKDIIYDNQLFHSSFGSQNKFLLLRYKTIPFLGTVVPTEWYNAAVLIILSVIALAISRLLLTSRAQDLFRVISDRAKDFFQFLRASFNQLISRILPGRSGQ
ncbi:MAG: ATP-binding cassette domain-containing protein, partial [Verrucomicrobia bacterium]|nr:ATP-binding cassette domain-containing protein [Verrucomicrobiota bacterium]